MKTIRHHTTHLYYDGIQLFEARDSIGGHYIAAAVDAGGPQDFVVVGVSPERLRQFRTGRIDLLTLMTAGEEAEWFIGQFGEDYQEPLLLEAQQHSPIPDAFLPLPESFLFAIAPGDEVVRLAREQNCLVVEFALDPPEAATGHRIHAARLGEFLLKVQGLVKHAWIASLRDLTANAKRQIAMLDAEILDVLVAAAPGSFRIILGGKPSNDLFGNCDVRHALNRLDSLFADVADPERAAAVARANKGHLAGSYLRMLNFIMESQTNLRYGWATPDSATPRRCAITELQARPIVELLMRQNDLSEQTVVLDGELQGADKKDGTWQLAVGKKVLSGISADGGAMVDGLVIGKRYRFQCKEEVQELEISGKERTTRTLLALPEALDQLSIAEQEAE